MWNRTLVVCLISAASCSGSRAGTDEVNEADDIEDDGDSEYTESVEPLTLRRVQQSLVNQGCQSLRLIESVELEYPEGLVMVVEAELCEGFEQDGLAAFLISAVGNEFIQSNTLHPLPGIGEPATSAVEILSLEAPRVQESGSSVVYLRYRTPASSAGGNHFVERVIVGTFSAEALELSVVQPVNYDVRLGSGRMTGEGRVELEDTDNDGDLDIVFDLTATGRSCGQSDRCRNGEHRCQQTTAWTGRRFSENLEGDGCIFLGQLEL